MSIGGAGGMLSRFLPQKGAGKERATAALLTARRPGEAVHMTLLAVQIKISCWSMCVHHDTPAH